MNVITAIALTWLVAAPVPKASTAEEVKKSIQGEWKIVECMKGGESEDELTGAKVVVKDTEMQILRGEREEKISFTLDTKTDPPAIDLVSMKDKDKLVKGIYKLEKDKLTICVGLDGTNRPKEFKSTKKLETGLLILERVKK